MLSLERVMNQQLIDSRSLSLSRDIRRYKSGDIVLAKRKYGKTIGRLGAFSPECGWTIHHVDFDSIWGLIKEEDIISFADERMRDLVCP